MVNAIRVPAIHLRRLLSLLKSIPSYALHTLNVAKLQKLIYLYVSAPRDAIKRAKFLRIKGRN